VALAGAELLLRAQGSQPWVYTTKDLSEPTIHVPDPVLGWRARPGHHVVPPPSPNAAPAVFTFREDGSRLIGREIGEGSKVVFIGCSLTQGWAISDHETFAYLLQVRFPSFRVFNHGTAGYGTFQSLLILEEILATQDPPSTVFYGLCEDHERRNVATPAWLRGLASYSRRGTVRVPYCTLTAEHRLERHPPEAHPEWPMRRSLALVNLAERRYATFRGRHRASQGRAVTELLLLELSRLAAAHGIRFAAVLLNTDRDDTKTHYVQYSRAHGIDMIDCAFPLTDDMRVPGDWHANAKMNGRWADCISPSLENLSIGLDQAPRAGLVSTPQPATSSGHE